MLFYCCSCLQQVRTCSQVEKVKKKCIHNLIVKLKYYWQLVFCLEVLSSYQQYPKSHCQPSKNPTFKTSKTEVTSLIEPTLIHFFSCFFLNRDLTCFYTRYLFLFNQLLPCKSHNKIQGYETSRISFYCSCSPGSYLYPNPQYPLSSWLLRNTVSWSFQLVPS